MSWTPENPTSPRATFVIVFDYNGDRRFWSGKRWVVEYPDAEEYTEETAGLRALRGVEARASLKDGEACLVRRYGYEDEQVVRWSGSAPGVSP